jgi:hypothetical protein
MSASSEHHLFVFILLLLTRITSSLFKGLSVEKPDLGAWVTSTYFLVDG